MSTTQQGTFGGSRQTNTALSGGVRLTLALRFFENDALAEYRIEFHDLDLALDGFFILAAPDDVI